MRLMVACRAFDNMAGGVERQAIGLMNEMVARGHEVYFLTWDHENARTFYPMDDKVQWFKLGMGDHMKKAGWHLRLQRMMKVRQVVRDSRPDVILAFQQGTFLSMRLYTAGIGIPVIAAIRNALSILDFTTAGNRRRFFFQSLRLAKLVTVQFEAYREEYPAFLRSKIRAVPNAIRPADTSVKKDEKESGGPLLLTVGRLSFQKNFKTLIESFLLLAETFPDWRLVIAGEGEQREALEKLITERNAGERIELLGAVKDVEGLYRQADIFCIPSLWEGFPNTLSEALAHGVPSVGFQKCAGVNQLIVSGENGFLAENKEKPEDEVKSLADTLARLMQDKLLRERMKEKAFQSMELYRPERVYDMWENTLKEAVR